MGKTAQIQPHRYGRYQAKYFFHRCLSSGSGGPPEPWKTIKVSCIFKATCISLLHLMVSKLIPRTVALCHPFPLENPRDLLVQVDEVLSQTDYPFQSPLREDIFTEVENEFKADLNKYHWLCRDYKSPTECQHDVPFHWINVPGNPSLLLRTEEPLLESSTISLLQDVASDWLSKEKRSSLFTYQRKGNKEAHLSDLCSFNATLRTAMRDCLFQKIFPLVESQFLETDYQPRIYDSLFIRYNSSEAGDFIGAGQPLHRDLGVVSVNIMLNNEFEGGGTLFEAQLTSDSTQPVLPQMRGNALIHFSSRRHAGAGTRSGVRDILVIFLSAVSVKGDMHPIERAARLKGKASAQRDFAFKALLHRSALHFAEDDGEAWHYLGMCLDKLSIQATKTSEIAVSTLLYASSLIPNDARLLNNLGLLLGRQGGARATIEKYYQRSLELHLMCRELGCDVTFDLETTALNYGLFLANRNEWESAICVLSHIKTHKQESNQLHEHAKALSNFCLTQAAQES